MKIKIFFSVFVLTVMGFSLFSCSNDVETIEIQDLYKYDSQYYENLRQFKKSPHEISYAYYASWSNSQNPTSWGERFLGLPDSLDIVNLWTDIPTKESFPTAYKDMVYCQQAKGTRFVMHADAANYNHYFWDRVWNEKTLQFDYVYETTKNATTGEEEYVLDEKGNKKHKMVKTIPGNEESLRSYARWAVDTVVQCGLDGVDFDFEGWGDGDMGIVGNECNKYLGPQGKWAEKLFIVDFFGGSPSTCDNYCDYFIRQAYSWQIGFSTGSDGRPVDRTVLCESTGAEAKDGGVNGAMVREYAAFEPTTGNKGGFGAYYLDYNYKSQSGIPYKEFREAIQIQNPAVKK